MTALLVSHQCNVDYGSDLAAFAARDKFPLELHDARIYAIFLESLRRWMRGAPLLNEVIKPRAESPRQGEVLK